MSDSTAEPVAIITGAGSGVGAACAHRFSAAGYHVGLLDRDEHSAREVATALDATLTRVLYARVDVTDSADIATAIRAIDNRWGRIDAVINNAGVPHPATDFDKLSDQQWTSAFEVNVRGIARVTDAALPLLKRSRGAVVNVTSVAGVRARAGLAAYCASKAAAISLTQTLALELAPYGVRVNSIGPGALDTPMFGSFLRPGETVTHGTERYAQAIPLGRLGTAAEIADAVVWAASKHAGFMTGQTIVIDGGRAI